MYLGASMPGLEVFQLVFTTLSPNEHTIHIFNTQGPTRASPSAFAKYTCHRACTMWKECEEFEPTVWQATGFPQGTEDHPEDVFPCRHTPTPQVITQPSMSRQTTGSLSTRQLHAWNVSDLWNCVCLKPLMHKAVTCHVDIGRALLAQHINTVKQKALTLFIGKGILTLPCSWCSLIETVSLLWGLRNKILQPGFDASKIARSHTCYVLPCKRIALQQCIFHWLNTLNKLVC